MISLIYIFIFIKILNYVLYTEKVLNSLVFIFGVPKIKK